MNVHPDDRGSHIRPLGDRTRAERTIEDIIRIYPGGAPTMVLLDRLDRMGLTEDQALSVLRELEARGRISTEHGRWVIGPVRSYEPA